MSNEALNSVLQSLMKFDDLGVLEITDPALLSAVAAGTGNSPYADHECGHDGGCTGDYTCSYDNVCVNDGVCY